MRAGQVECISFVEARHEANQRLIGIPFCVSVSFVNILLSTGLDFFLTNS